jgi:hypothetical protein
MNTEQLELPLQITSTTTKITATQIEAILRGTDWNAFWDKVAADAQPEIEAYRQAEARSRARAAEHWFL